MPKVCVLNSGGTLAMKPTSNGFQPQQGFLTEQLSRMEEMEMAPMPAFDVQEFEPLIDSSNVTPAVWMQIAQAIEANYDDYDGFVIVHGTDTMAYTASALPLILSGLSKPVILTGAQLPLGQLRNDARENLKTAMVLAANYDVPEVGLFFDERLLRGCRSTKVSATRFDAFDSPNYPSLAVAQTSITVFDEHVRRYASTDCGGSTNLQLNPIQPGSIASFRLFPGFSVEVLQHVLQPPLKALILETYGDGNGPSSNKEFLNSIAKAVDDGIVIVGCSQCLHGGVTQSKYATGKALAKAGVISGRDMTIEATFAKLLFLMSSKRTVAEIKQKMGEDLVGELTSKV